MKKYVMSLIMVVLLLSVTGCGEKKMTCTMKEEDGNNKMEASWVITHKDDKIVKAVNKNTIEADKETIDMYKSFVESSFDESYNDIKGFKISFDKDSDTKYEYEMSFDFKKLDFNELSSKMGGSESLDLSKDISLEVFKKNLSEQGYTCE